MSRPRDLDLRLSVLLIVCVGLAACAHPQRVPEPAPVGRVALIATETPAPESRQLDVGVRVFTNRGEGREALPINAATLKRIRTIETHYLPVVLRNTLIASNQWGVVRVLPEADPSVDLLIHGTIIESDGARLALRVTAVDSSGREWLDQTYRGRAFSIDYPDVMPIPGSEPAEPIKDPFQDVYAQIANDLLLTRMVLDDEELARLRRISEMKHARDLSPEAFGAMLQTDAEGHLDVQRLPAFNDPIFDRVQAIRERHHAFIDTVDGYYVALHREVKPLYALWRQYANDHAEGMRRSEARNPDQTGGHDSFGALRRSYDRYRWAKTFEQEFVGLASGFVSETAPAMLEMQRKLDGLTGSVEELYARWRELLRKLYEVDTGDGGASSI